MPFPPLDPNFDPLSLSPFIWLDPSDLSTLFQERTGASATTPSVVDGIVGSMHDKSASDLWLTAPSDAARPILRSLDGLYWLEFDGTDDVLLTTFDEINQPWEAVSALQHFDNLADNAHMISSATVRGAIFLASPAGTVAIFSGSVLDSTVAPAADVSFIVTDRYNGASSRIAIDDGAYVTGDAGADPVSSIYLGATGGPAEFAAVRFFGRTQFDRLLTDPEILQLQTYAAFKQGRTGLLVLPNFVGSEGGGSGRLRQPGRPWWWRSYNEQLLDELQERKREHERLKQITPEEITEAAERARAEGEARREQQAREAAEEASRNDASLRRRLKPIMDARDAKRAEQQRRVDEALERVRMRNKR